MSFCAACQKSITLGERVGRRDECPLCHADLHACRQCRFYDLSAHNQCREPQADWVSDKEKANFCDYFEFAMDKRHAPTESSLAKKKLEQLFRK